MNGWELDDLMDVLAQARNGNADKLNTFLQGYSFAVANADFSTLLVLRHFMASTNKKERRVLNCKPDDDDFQWGITIVTSDKSGGSETNVYVPNSLTYKGIQIDHKQITLLSDQQTTITNVTELLRKLHFWGKFTEGDIETGFKKLINENYETEKISKPKIKNKTIENHVLGKLTYNEDLEWFESAYNKNGVAFQISIGFTTTKKLEKIIEFAEQQICKEFYKESLLEMETKMIKLKNNTWLGEDDYGKDELPITVEQFRQRVSIESINFYDDFSSEIYCLDDDIFFGHTIIIKIDKKGKFMNASLAG